MDSIDSMRYCTRNDDIGLNVKHRHVLEPVSYQLDFTLLGFCIDCLYGKCVYFGGDVTVTGIIVFSSITKTVVWVFVYVSHSSEPALYCVKWLHRIFTAVIIEVAMLLFIPMDTCVQPNRTYYLEDQEGNALKWCKQIEEVLKHYYGNNVTATPRVTSKSWLRLLHQVLPCACAVLYLMSRLIIIAADCCTSVVHNHQLVI